MNCVRQKPPAAFFDVDGTLLPAPSLERRLLWFLFERGEWSPLSFASWLGRFLSAAALDGKGANGERFLRAVQGNKLYWKNIRTSSVEDLLAEGAVPDFFPEGLLRIAWHAEQGHRIFLVTGTLYRLAEGIAQKYEERLRQGARPGFVGVSATRLEERDGRCTGEIAGEAVCGRGKARAIERLAEEHGLDLERSFAYGNSTADQWMLARVGHPAAVNPSPVLRRVALAKEWPVLSWGKNLPQRHRATENKKEERNQYTMGVPADWRRALRRKA